MNSEPLVSIGVPVFNGGQYIRQALDSLLAQSYRNLELQISDNASTDDTAEICRSYLAKDNRVGYHRNSCNVGIMGNFRRALQLASGEYFMWAAHDDYWSTSYVEVLLECLRASRQAVLAAGKTLYADIEGKLRNVEPDEAPDPNLNPNLDTARQLLQQHAHAWAHGLFRRDDLIKLTPSYFASDPWGADMVFLLQLCLSREVVGSNAAIIYKRTTGVSGPKTPRQRVKWQCAFAVALLQVIRKSSLPAEDKRELFRVYIAYLKWLYLRRGVVPWAKLWAKAACHWSLGIDRP